MGKAVHLPFNEGEAKKVGPRLFRKQLLPVGSLEHNGEKLDFTPEYLEKLAANFSAGKRDQVPFVLVNEKNQHVSSPENYRGEVKEMEVGGDGLYVTLELSEEGAALIERNPKLGVSARIAPGDDADPDIEHVAATLNPVVKGMKPWERVNLSDEQLAEAIDLSGLRYSVAVTPSALKDLKPEELSALRDLAAKVKSGEIELSNDEDAERALAALLEDVEDPEPKPVELSEEQRQVIELAESKAKDAERAAASAQERVGALETELATQRFESEKAELIAAGVPPADIELAEELLKGGSQTIELSNGEKVDASEVTRKLLEQRKGTIDYEEIGLTAGADDDEVVELADQWEKDEPMTIGGDS